MRILHLSDIHIKSENDKDIYTFILDPFITDVLNFKKKKDFDLVLITGDIVDKGASSFQSRNNCYDAFVTYFATPLIEKLSLTRERFYFVPGNHDIWRDSDSKVSELGLRQILLNTDEVNKQIDGNSEEGIRRIIPFKTFESQFYSQCKNCLLTKYHSLFNVKIDSVNVGIACLNSAWRSYDDATDRHTLIVGERQISAAKDYFKNTTVNIALLHHPLEWLADFDRRSIEPLLENSFHLVFCGHVHSGSSWVKSGIYKGVFVSVAPPNWQYGIRESDRDFCNGYSVIDFDPMSSELQVTHRRYSYRKNAYVPNNDVGDDFGILKLKLPSSGELKLRNYEHELAMTIKNSHYGELNEHLLTYNTDTKAPRDLQGIFVLPRVVEKVKFEGEKKQKEKPLSIDDMCSYSESQIIFGVKESGKTILLDRILVHLSDNIGNCRLTPVYLDFRQIKSSRIETLIARYLGISITYVKELLAEHKILLLVDNLSFNEYDNKPLATLENFLRDTPSAKMIGASLQAAEGALPIELFEYPFYASLRKLHIKSFGSTETRQLIKNWFSANPSPDVEGKIEKLLDTLLMLNLPRTPL